MGKIIITGTGRCGSSFLVHLMSAMGLDTGYTEKQCEDELKNECRGGLEHTIEKPFRIMKNPNFAIDIENIVSNHDIDHVIIPIRDLEATAKSREKNNMNHGRYGGFWFGADSVDTQEIEHARLLYNLIECLSRNGVPFTVVSFPRIVKDGAYLYSKLYKVFYADMVNQKEFAAAFNRIADVNKVNF